LYNQYPPYQHWLKWNEECEQKREEWQTNCIEEISEQLLRDEDTQTAIDIQKDLKTLLLHQWAWKIVRDDECEGQEKWMEDVAFEKKLKHPYPRCIPLTGRKICGPFFLQPLWVRDRDFTQEKATSLLQLLVQSDVSSGPIDVDSSENAHDFEHLSEDMQKVMLSLPLFTRRSSLWQRCGNLMQEHPYKTIGLGTTVLVATFGVGVYAGPSLKAIAQKAWTHS